MGKVSKVPSKVRLVSEHKVQELTSAYKLSYSQLSTYLNCNHQWYLQYVKKLSKYQPSIHTVFGTALHEAVQTWLNTLYNKSVKASNEIDLAELLKTTLRTTFIKESKSGTDFTDAKQLQEFYEDGIQILEYLKKKRAVYFSTRKVYLAGVEVQLQLELKPNTYFKGFIDLVFYDEDLDKWLLLDIKTSTTGWNEAAKKDDKKIAQLILYKTYFAQQFGIPVDSIDVEYFIVKRKVPEDAEFPSMMKRVQQFRPASGRVKQGQVKQMVGTFLQQATNGQGEVLEKEYKKELTAKACRFCEFKDSPYCTESKNVK